MFLAKDFSGHCFVELYAVCCLQSTSVAKGLILDVKVNVKDHSIQKPVRCKLSVMWVSCIQTYHTCG